MGITRDLRRAARRAARVSRGMPCSGAQWANALARCVDVAHARAVLALRSTVQGGAAARDEYLSMWARAQGEALALARAWRLRAEARGEGVP